MGKNKRRRRGDDDHDDHDDERRKKRERTRGRSDVLPPGYTQMDGIDPSEHRALIVGVAANGNGWSGGTPTRRTDGTLKFDEWPDFRPNLTPEEILRAGSFGGGYFRNIRSAVTSAEYEEVWKELPSSWIRGLDLDTMIRSDTYNKTVNTYKVDCGAKSTPRKTDPFGQLYWESKHWIIAQDPYGWFQWYCRFYQGRRSDDDGRQIQRWCKCAGKRGRWKRNLVAKCLRHGGTEPWNNRTISPVVRQTLQHWGYRLTRRDFDADSDIVRARGASYFPRSQVPALSKRPTKR